MVDFIYSLWAKSIVSVQFSRVHISFSYLNVDFHTYYNQAEDGYFNGVIVLFIFLPFIGSFFNTTCNPKGKQIINRQTQLGSCLYACSFDLNADIALLLTVV